ncbi:MAG: hypothetical protein HOW73_04465 [Polyangiaceae bacterium]|nr:hypothetical protein [Polyangiaceae bacterium]
MTLSKRLMISTGDRLINGARATYRLVLWSSRIVAEIRAERASAAVRSQAAAVHASADGLDAKRTVIVPPSSRPEIW